MWATYFFAILSIAVIGVALFVLWRMQRRFKAAPNRSNAVLYVLAGSFAVYGIAVAVDALNLFQHRIATEPAMLLIPAALTLVAVITIKQAPAAG